MIHLPTGETKIIEEDFRLNGVGYFGQTMPLFSEQTVPLKETAIIRQKS
ncbi:MAG: hypothetical protein ACK5L5_04585 [Bacteroidales bacterium]